MISDSFKKEKIVLETSEGLLECSEGVDYKSEFDKLLKQYKKLLKTTDRLMRVSDSNENRLKQVNIQVSRQQHELEKNHAELSQHAEVLEAKVADRTKDLKAAQEKLEKLVEIGIALSKERNLNRFKEMILSGAKELTNADGGGLLLFDEASETLRYELFGVDSLDLHFGGNSGRTIPFEPILLRDPETSRPYYFNIIPHTALTRRTVSIPQIRESSDFDFSDIEAFDKSFDYRSQSYLAVPLKKNEGEVVGLLVLFNARVKGTGRVIPFSHEMTGFVEGLASQAAVALINQQLLDSQQQLLDSLIRLIASAIDAKSPYTGGHCERVVVLSEMLARAACQSETGPWADFDMHESEWREFKIAAWLHDCGKITTPEYVVDKATKLETIYNRIHEVRTRFEVLYRDCFIEYQKALLEMEKDDTELHPDQKSELETEQKKQLKVQRQAQLQKELDEKLNRLQDDFSFVANCNVGGEFMDENRKKRLDQIALITWERHFDDRLGLSQAELYRLKGIPQHSLPAVENLLSDRKEHLIPTPDVSSPYDAKQYGFQVKEPEYMFNNGECYNLKIAKGTLTEEERFKIIEHAIQTIVMLDKLPFPRNLSQVVEIAGAHHETMAGNGYPKKLDGATIPLKARILAIADVFEALTASDRPYKKAKTLSEAIRILGFMKKDRHIDPDLFDLFVSNGVYDQYARRYLNKDQIDEVDVATLCGKC